MDEQANKLFQSAMGVLLLFHPDDDDHVSIIDVFGDARLLSKESAARVKQLREDVQEFSDGLKVSMEG